MSAVVDASLLVGALTGSGREGRWCEAALERPAIAAPELALAETANILRRLELSGAISPLEATAALRELLRLDTSANSGGRWTAAIECYPFGPFAERVWELRANLTVYDAWYVALAEALDWPLLTLDRRISRASGPRCEVIVPPAPPEHDQ